MRTTRNQFGVIISILCVLLVPGKHALSADQEAITLDGREVLLKEDGTWQFLSSDRFANTKDGRLVKLKEDGSWEHAGNVAMTSAKHLRTKHLNIKLDNVVVEKHEKKVHKNVRTTSQTVFYLSLDLSALAKNNINIAKADINHIEVKDNNGKNYPPLSIQPSPTTIKPNSKTTIIVRVDGAPLWLSTAKIMFITFKPEIFGIQDPITFSWRIADFGEKKVDGFDKIN